MTKPLSFIVLLTAILGLSACATGNTPEAKKANTHNNKDKGKKEAEHERVKKKIKPLSYQFKISNWKRIGNNP